MKNFLIFLAAASLSGFFYGQAQAQQAPEDMFTDTLPLMVHCVMGLGRMTDLLEQDFSEKPVMYSDMSDAISLIFFTNKSRTTGTLVVNYHNKGNGKDLSCILFGGESPEGFSFLTTP